MARASGVAAIARRRRGSVRLIDQDDPTWNSRDGLFHVSLNGQRRRGTGPTAARFLFLRKAGQPGDPVEPKAPEHDDHRQNQRRQGTQDESDRQSEAREPDQLVLRLPAQPAVMLPLGEDRPEERGTPELLVEPGR